MELQDIIVHAGKTYKNCFTLFLAFLPTTTVWIAAPVLISSLTGSALWAILLTLLLMLAVSPLCAGATRCCMEALRGEKVTRRWRMLFSFYRTPPRILRCLGVFFFSSILYDLLNYLPKVIPAAASLAFPIGFLRLGAKLLFFFAPMLLVVTPEAKIRDLLFGSDHLVGRHLGKAIPFILYYAICCLPALLPSLLLVGTGKTALVLALQILYISLMLPFLTLASLEFVFRLRLIDKKAALERMIHNKTESKDNTVAARKDGSLSPEQQELHNQMEQLASLPSDTYIWEVFIPDLRAYRPVDALQESGFYFRDSGVVQRLFAKTFEQLVQEIEQIPAPPRNSTAAQEAFVYKNNFLLCIRAIEASGGWRARFELSVNNI